MTEMPIVSEEYTYRIQGIDKVIGIYYVRASSDEEAMQKVKDGEYMCYTQDYVIGDEPDDMTILSKE